MPWCWAPSALTQGFHRRLSGVCIGPVPGCHGEPGPDLLGLALWWEELWETREGDCVEAVSSRLLVVHLGGGATCMESTVMRAHLYRVPRLPFPR